MKIYVISILFLQCLMHKVRANVNGQTNEKVPLLNEDGSATGTTITCSPYSVEDEAKDVEYVKYVLDTEEEGNSTVVWNQQPSKISFDQCASYAAESDAAMFYFDGETCETSDAVYERKEKTCNSTAAKMVYMQKGIQPVNTYCMDNGTRYDHGETWPVFDLPCVNYGRKRCENSVIIPERNTGGTSFVSHIEGVDYFRISKACLFKPKTHTGTFDESNAGSLCYQYKTISCGPLPPIEDTENLFFQEINGFLESPVGSSLESDELTISIFRNSSGNWNYGGYPSMPSNIPPSSDSTETCVSFTYFFPLSPQKSNCNEEKARSICCMLYETA